ncbi:hypothetical protein [Coleofasciculus chthonoplastes]|uniref:hypothetical protein n=1 Tax=Coleofasciculus chthonoplastes TaxID=64178 RepID=UPI0032F7CD12
MRKQIEERLEQLKREFASGQKLLTELEAKQKEVQYTLLRLHGAIQVLEEELAKNKSDSSEPDSLTPLPLNTESFSAIPNSASL